MRAFALGLTALLLAGALAGTIAGWHLYAADILLAILLVGLVVERTRYKPIHDEPPGPGWTSTEERFADPKTGRIVTVYYNSQTGKRCYVAD
jgi:hypothetical protein